MHLGGSNSPGKGQVLRWGTRQSCGPQNNHGPQHFPTYLSIAPSSSPDVQTGSGEPQHLYALPTNKEIFLTYCSPRMLQDLRNPSEFSHRGLGLPESEVLVRE